MAENDPDPIQPGTILAGKFRIEQVLGRGGMGVVVAAHHLQLDERVALKFLLPDALGNSEAVARFAREARAAVKIKSEHVARVTDVGTLDSGSPYMVMEYLQGTDLSDLVEHRGALPIADAVEYVLQACEALAEAHALGIVHRDLKPANLFLTNRADGSPSVKVLDFGISKVTTGTDSAMSMTRTATVMGSPLYMSPEQMASAKQVDTRTDIWAVGAILHELLTGRVPFSADTMPQLCAKILQEDPPSVRAIRPEVPVGLEQVVHRCLRKTPEERYPSVAELANDLLPFAPSRGRLSVERITKVITAAGLTDSNLSLPQSAGVVTAGGTTQGAWAGTQPQGQGTTKWVVAAVALVVLAVGATAAALGAFSPRVAETRQDAGVAAASREAMPTPGVAPHETAGPRGTATAMPDVAPASSRDESSEVPEPAASAQQGTAKVASKAPASKAPAPKAPAPPPPRPQTRLAQPRPNRTQATRTTAQPRSATQPRSTSEPDSKLPAVDLYQDRK